MRYAPSLLLAMSSLALSLPASAQTNTDQTGIDLLDPIIVTGLRPVAKDDITSSVSVLTAEDLSVRSSVYIADQLRAVPGLAVSRSGSVGGLNQIRIRGAEANQTLVLLDGIEVSDPVTGETDFGLWAGLDVARVEILRGEQSALYGSDAIGGVIAIETSKDTSLGALAEIGSRGSWQLNARGGIASDSSYLIASTANAITGGTDTSGLGGETDGSQYFSGALRGAVDLSATWKLTGLVRYSNASADFDEDTSFDGALNNTAAIVASEQLTLGSALVGNAFGLNHALRANFGSVQRDTQNSTFDNLTDGTRLKFGYSPSIQFGEAGGVRHTLSGLIAYESEDYERRNAPTSFGDPNQQADFNTFGLGAEYRLAAGPADFSASARFDENDGLFDDAFTWRIGGAYAFDAINGRLRGSVGEGVKNPTFTELFGFIPGSFSGNPDLSPERSIGWEIGWDQTLGTVETSLTYFNAKLEDEIFTAFDANFFSTPQNRTGDSKRQGIEFGANWQVTGQLSLSAQTTWTDSDDNNGVAEIRVPDWTGSLSANWQADAGWRAGLALDLVGEQTDLNFATFPASTVQLPTYALLSASFEVPLTERIAISLRGENLTDAAAVDVFGFNRTGAAGFIGIRLR